MSSTSLARRQRRIMTRREMPDTGMASFLRLSNPSDEVSRCRARYREIKCNSNQNWNLKDLKAAIVNDALYLRSGEDLWGPWRGYGATLIARPQSSLSSAL
jgi:hypothetical protein